MKMGRTLWEGRKKSWKGNEVEHGNVSLLRRSLYLFRLLSRAPPLFPSRWWIFVGGYYCGLHDGRQLFKTIYSVCIVPSPPFAKSRSLCCHWLSFRAIKKHALRSIIASLLSLHYCFFFFKEKIYYNEQL